MCWCDFVLFINTLWQWSQCRLKSNCNPPKEEIEVKEKGGAAEEAAALLCVEIKVKEKCSVQMFDIYS